MEDEHLEGSKSVVQQLKSHPYLCLEKKYTEIYHTASFIVKIYEITFPKQDLLGSTSLGKVSRLGLTEKIGLKRTGIRRKQTSPVFVKL